METFTYDVMSSQSVYEIKKTFQEQRNNIVALEEFDTIQKETQKAISNIEIAVKSEDELRQLLINLRIRDVPIL